MALLTLTFVLAVVLFFETILLIPLMLLDSRATTYRLGFGAAVLIFVMGAVVSAVWQWAYAGLGGAGRSPLFVGLILSSVATVPALLIMVWHAMRLPPSRMSRPGRCWCCRYDLRGSQASSHCPECGAAIERADSVDASGRS